MPIVASLTQTMQGEEKGSQEWTNNRMLIVTSLTQPGGRERVERMKKQSNAHRHKPNSTRVEEKGSQEWTNNRMLIVASLTQPGGRERVSRMNKQSNAHRRKPNSTRRKREGCKNEQRKNVYHHKPSSTCWKRKGIRINKQYLSIVTGLINSTLMETE